MAAIVLRGVGKRFGRTRVIETLDLAVQDKEFVVFVGPSGCGKSTLLRLVAGLEDLSEGAILFDGRDVSDLPPAERGIAMVFQSYALYPHMSVFDNMAFGLKLARLGRSGIAERVHKAARILQLEPLLERKPRELSGGQRQRVAIGRAIVRDPRVFLFDEPLSNLDAALRVQMRIEIARLHRQLDATMLYVTHDQVEAMTLADRIVVLNGGVMEQVGTPLELYEHPRNLFVAGFIGSPKMNFISAEVAARGADTVTLALDGGMRLELPAAAAAVHAGQRLTLGLRPEHLSLGRAGDVRLPGTVVAVERLGGESYVYVDAGGAEPLVVKADGHCEARVGEAIEPALRVASCYMFDADGQALPRPGRR